MIYDSQEQKNFIAKVLLAYNCSYAEHQTINQTYAPAIQSGVVIPVEMQQAFVDEHYPKQTKPTEKTEE